MATTNMIITTRAMIMQSINKYDDDNDGDNDYKWSNDGD